VRRLTYNERDDIFPSWSPDGSRIAFASDRYGDWEIYTMSSEGYDVRQLTKPDSRPAVKWSPAWSPDGSRIAFAYFPGNNSDDAEIYTMLADGSDVRQLTESGGGFPAWSPVLP